MAKNAQAKAAPSLADLLTASQAESNALADLEAKQAAEREAVAAKAKAAEEAAQAAVDGALAPYRAERDAIIVAQVEAIAARKETTEPIVSAYQSKVAKLKEKFDKDFAEAIAPFDKALSVSETELAALEARMTEETGIPAVLFNADIAPAPKAKATKGGSTKPSARKSPKVIDLGTMGPVLVTAPKRYPSLDPTNPVTVQYEVAEDGGVTKLFAKRVDKVVDGAHVVTDAALQAPYTHASTVASEVTTTPGWHSTKDVMFALLTVAGKTGDWTEFGPDSEASDILVNGEPLATKEVAHEATILKETV